MAERIANYCDAVLNVESLCKPGYRCCVSRDLFGDSPPAELLVIDRTKSNLTRVEETSPTSASAVTAALSHHASGPSTAVAVHAASTTTTTTTTARTTTTTTTTTTPPTTQTSTPRPRPASQEPPKPCTGECVSPFFALICENVDTEADCGDSGYCCIRDNVLKQVRTGRLGSVVFTLVYFN
jgi:kallikrein